MPNHATASTAGKPASRVVGVSGRAGARFSPVTASARIRPSRMWPSEEGRLSTARSTRPAITSVSIGPEPRKGTWTKSIPAACFSNSPVRCRLVPLPELPIVRPSRRRLASATASGSVRASTFGAATMTFGTPAMLDTAAKPSWPLLRPR